MDWRIVVLSNEDCELLHKVDEGIADEREGRKYWQQMGLKFKDVGMPEEAESAHEFAGDELKHRHLLEEVKQSNWRAILTA